MSDNSDEYALDHDVAKKAVDDDLILYERASAEERQRRDQLIAHWSNLIHSFLKMPGQNDYALLHMVVDSMDNFLNRAGGRRK